SDVAPAASTAQNLVTYLATVKLDKPAASIRGGMTAEATIYTARKQGVLLVPNQALQSYQGRQIVMTLGPDGQPKATDVQLGLSDTKNTEVLGGVNEGQRVLIAGPLSAIATEGK